MTYVSRDYLEQRWSIPADDATTIMDALAALSNYAVAHAEQREEWLQARTGMVTASDCAAAIPISQGHRNVLTEKLKRGSYHEYKGREELLREKQTGLPNPDADNFWTREGRRAEGFILESAREEWGWKLFPMQILYRDSVCEHLGATPDAIRVTEGGELELVQAKFTKCMPGSWTNNLPSYIWHQVQAEMAVTEPAGVVRCRVLAYHRFERKGLPLRSYVVQPDKAAQGVIRACASNLMQEAGNA